jgi:eukaryotic-like serine/threonine-protein kinase
VAAGPYYEILGRLGNGGMGEILLARNTTTRDISRYVVLKRMAASNDYDDDALAAFMYEARISFGLSHPNIAQVFDFHEFAGVYYLAIEYIPGVSVLQLLRKATASKQRVPLAHILTIAVGACAGLHYSHTRCANDGGPHDIIHRDISPSNIMLSFEGAVKLIDFGIAKSHDDHDLPKSGTGKGLIKGKAGYLSPERIVGSPPVDRRCDVFSLGVVLWELLAGRGLFQRPTEFATLEATLHETPPALSQLRPGIPSSIEAVVMRAINKYPSQRFDSAANMLVAIESAAHGAQISLSNWNLGAYLKQLCRVDNVDSVDSALARPPTLTRPETFGACGTDTDGFLVDEQAITPGWDLPWESPRDGATELIPGAPRQTDDRDTATTAS